MLEVDSTVALNLLSYALYLYWNFAFILAKESFTKTFIFHAGC